LIAERGVIYHVCMSGLLDLLGIALPIIQAPMANVSTPAMAAAVSNAGALGSISVGATDAEAARSMIAAVRDLTDRPFLVNVFCHRPAVADAVREAAWIERLAPHFAKFNAAPPARLREIYRSFIADDEMLAVFLDTRPRVVSFHFGLPDQRRIAALRNAGIALLATATNLDEARAIEHAGVHAVVAQGSEAGGHRGVFDSTPRDEQLGTFTLVRLLAREIPIPIVAAGGIMDGAGIAAALDLGASAVQLGTAFIACDESAADAAFRAKLLSEASRHTVMTRAISGRVARCIGNEMTAIGETLSDQRIVPAYPIAYDAGKALNAAAKAKGEYGYAAHWAGQGAPLARSMRAAELVRTLERELNAARSVERK
jgi:nitronate monooxygenase